MFFIIVDMRHYLNIEMFNAYFDTRQQQKKKQQILFNFLLSEYKIEIAFYILFNEINLF